MKGKGKREKGKGSREQGKGKREQGTGKRKRGFAYTLNRSLVSCFILFSLFNFLLLSCAPGGNPDSDISEGMGRVTLRFADTVGRTILPSAPANLNYFSRFQVKFHDTDTDTPVTGSPSTVSWGTSPATEAITVPPGNYIITVDAFTTVNSVSTLAARGVAGTELSPIPIAANQTNTVPVTLKMLLGESGTTGTFTWDITLPEPPAPPATGLNITKAEMEIFTLGGGKQGGTIDLLDTPDGTHTPLNSAMYNVVVNLVHTENFGTSATDFARSVVIWYETLHIYSTLTSNWNYTFTEDHFRLENYIVTFDHNYSPKPADLKQSVLHGATIGNMPTPTRTGYTLDGWYTNSVAASGVKWEGTGTGFEIYGDMTLFANWIEDTTVVINVSVDPITDANIIFVDDDGDPTTLPSLITLSRSGTSPNPDAYSFKIGNYTEFSSIEWLIAKADGTGDFGDAGNIFEINANAFEYNSIGGHLLRLVVEKYVGDDPVTYQINIPFRIVP